MNEPKKVLTPEEEAIHERAKKDGITRAHAAELILREQAEPAKPKRAKDE